MLTPLTVGRWIAAAVGIFFGMSAFGGLMLGITTRHGGFLAVACLSAGIALGSGMWWHLSRFPTYRDPLMGLSLISVCLVAGLALDSNLTYLLWGIGFPMEIGTVKDGRMAEVYWLPPLTLLYAVFGYAVLTYLAKKKT